MYLVQCFDRLQIHQIPFPSWQFGLNCVQCCAVYCSVIRWLPCDCVSSCTLLHRTELTLWKGLYNLQHFFFISLFILELLHGDFLLRTASQFLRCLHIYLFSPFLSAILLWLGSVSGSYDRFDLYHWLNDLAFEHGKIHPLDPLKKIFLFIFFSFPSGIFYRHFRNFIFLLNVFHACAFMFKCSYSHL